MKIGDIKKNNYEIHILPNTSDEFEFLSIVNGLYNTKGGNHIQYIIDKIIPPIRQKLQKKYKSIMPADIKNKLKIVFMMRFFPDQEYNSQTKDFLANSQKEVSDFLNIEQKQWDKITNAILKDSEFIDRITDYFKIKEEFQEQQKLKKVKSTKKKKIVDDNFLVSIGAKRNIFLCEGLSASASISNILGRNNNAYLALFGVPMNAWGTKTIKVALSKKFLLLSEILNVDYTTKMTNSIYDNIIIATDADLPGTHIKGLLMAYFHLYGKNLIKDKRLKILKTPLVFAYNRNRLAKYFFDFESYKEYEKKHPTYTFSYTKGLGTLDKKVMQKLFEEKGLDYFCETIEYSDDIKMDENSLDVWFNSKNSDMRKKYIKEQPFNINML